MKKNSHSPKRKHIPALTPEKLQLALQQLEGVKISAAAKKQLRLMLQAAANPNAERIDVVVKTLPPERRAMIDRTAKELRRLNAETLQRGKTKLDTMSDEEWQRLVDDSAD